MGNAQEMLPPADEDDVGVDLRRLASWRRAEKEEDEEERRRGPPAEGAEEEDDDGEEEPRQLDTLNSSGAFHRVSLDKLSVHYPGHPRHAHDVGAVQADRPAPSRRLLYYFEMTVLHAGPKPLLAIGFTPPAAKLCRHPGWEENSCGYRGDDGMVYRGQETGEAFGPAFAAGDTVGAGINYAAQQFFFTKNGNFVGAVAKNTKGPLFPTVAVHSQNEEVAVNFGNHPFLFNVEAYALEQRTKQQAAIENSVLPPDLSHRIVRSYLLHYGYEDTLISFDAATGDSFRPQPITQESAADRSEAYALNHRKILRQLIRSGEIDSAVEKLQQWYPQTLQNETSTLCFLLRSQKFIEYIKIGESEAAVRFARTHLAKFFSVKPLAGLLQNCIALLAYDQPTESCVGYLLDVNQRELVADAVNAVILLTDSATIDRRIIFSSRLEKLLKQLTACCTEKRALSGDQGETFNLHRVLCAAGSRTSIA